MRIKKTFDFTKNYTVIRNAEFDHSDSPEIVNELPAVCPDCSGKLKKIQVKIYY